MLRRKRETKDPLKLDSLEDHPLVAEARERLEALERRVGEKGRVVDEARSALEKAELRGVARAVEGEEPDSAEMDLLAQAVTTAERDLRIAKAAVEQLDSIEIDKARKEAREELAPFFRKALVEHVDALDTVLGLAFEKNNALLALRNQARSVLGTGVVPEAAPFAPLLQDHTGVSLMTRWLDINRQEGLIPGGRREEKKGSRALKRALENMLDPPLQERVQGRNVGLPPPGRDILGRPKR